MVKKTKEQMVKELEEKRQGEGFDSLFIYSRGGCWL